MIDFDWLRSAAKNHRDVAIVDPADYGPRLAKMKGVSATSKARKPAGTDDRWPCGRDVFKSFHHSLDYPPFNFPMQARLYEKAMRLAFGGRRLTILDHEVKELTGVVATDATDPETGKQLRETRKFKRVFLKLEMDAWIKEPDPSVTCWERFKLWLTNQPLPKAREPDRTVVYYSMSQYQVDIFRRLWAKEFAHEVEHEGDL